MNTLSIESINAKAPYKVKFEPETGAYLFTSDSNIYYLVDFTLDNLVKSDKAYQFAIANVNHKKSPRDKHLKDTVIAIIEEFFESSIRTNRFNASRKSQDSRCQIKRHRCAIYIYDFGFKSTSSNDDKLAQ